MMSMAWEPVGSPDTHSVSDEELVVRFQANDVTAFDALIQRYAHPLRRYLVGLVGEDYADDLIQETFIRAHRNLPPMQELRSFKAWLYRIATNLARDHRRHTILIRWLPWKEHKELSADRCIFVEGPEQAVEEAEFISKIMAQVSAKYRPCLYLDIFEDMKQQEIADILSISGRTVRRYIFLGKEQLRKAYERFTSQQEPL